MKNILLFFPDCPFNEDNGAGIYFKNVIRFLNKYYDVNIFCLVGRYNLNNEQKTFINSINYLLYPPCSTKTIPLLQILPSYGADQY